LLVYLKHNFKNNIKQIITTCGCILLLADYD
jgi:hypothetical protein